MILSLKIKCLIYNSMRNTFYFPVLVLLLLSSSCTDPKPMTTIFVTEENGLQRDLEYVTATIQWREALKTKEVPVVVDGVSGVSIPVQIIDTIMNQDLFSLKILFPVSIQANQTKEFHIKSEEKKQTAIPSSLIVSDGGHFVENAIYKASLSTENDKRGGQINGIALKNFNDQVLKRGHIAMHWAPNFSKSNSDGYYNMENLPQSSENSIKRGPYLVEKKRSGVADKVPEINLQGQYTFFDKLPYFEFASTMTVIKDVELNLLRNDEMTMDSLFTHVMYTMPDGRISHLKLYDEELDQLEENPISDDASWLAFYNVEKGYGLGCIRLEYDNTNLEGGLSTILKPYTKITRSKGNGRYWNRRLLGTDDDVIVKKGDRYKEKNAYLVFKVDESAPEKEMQYYAERLMNPLMVNVEMP